MKSVIQEASSLSKAIEQGWVKAGKPKEFTVKIFQDAEKGFLGLGVKQQAKIGIFFEDAPVQGRSEVHGQRSLQQRPREQRRARPEQRSEHRREHRQDQQQRERKQHHRPDRRGERTASPERELVLPTNGLWS